MKHLCRIDTLSLLLLLGILATLPRAHAEILILQSSDNHSEYSAIPNYIKSTSALARDFRTQHSNGEIIHLVNGDLAGPSQWTDFDRGGLNYALFAQLSAHYRVIMNMGNHDAFDYQGEQGNKLFRDQVRLYKRISKTSIKNANVKATQAGRELFSPAQDFVSPTGTKIRVVGLVLDDLFSYSTYSPTAKTQLIEQVRPMLEEAKGQLSKAATEGVNSIIFQCHEAFANVEQLTRELLAWKQSRPELSKVTLPLVFAAHDHEVHQTMVAETLIFDSGTNYAFTRVILDDDGRPKSFDHFDLKKQMEFADYDQLLPREQVALRATESMLRKVSRLNSKVIATGLAAFSEGRTELKLGRNPLGLAIGDMLVEWAREEITTNPPNSPVTNIVSFFNSGSYRRARGLPGDTLTLGDIKGMTLPGQAQIVIVPGSRIQAMYTALRKYGISQQNQHTPQLPSHVREGAKYQLFLRESDGKWSPIDPAANYVLALDRWLSSNGFKITDPSWDLSNATKYVSSIAEQIDILLKYLPRYLKQNDPKICEALLSGA